ncbi:MAG: hypothetical protein R2771_04945 [Saprospiraceae bacterium]
MAFGNPYNDIYNFSLVNEWVKKISDIGVSVVVLSDTVGVGERNVIHELFDLVINEFPEIEFGAHLHSRPDNWYEKVEAAYDSGCRRFDGALKGFGGCPMSGLDLVGNISTENLIHFMEEKGEKTNIKADVLKEVMKATNSFYPLS